MMADSLQLARSLWGMQHCMQAGPDMCRRGVLVKVPQVKAVQALSPWYMCPAQRSFTAYGTQPEAYTKRVSAACLSTVITHTYTCSSSLLACSLTAGRCSVRSSTLPCRAVMCCACCPVEEVWTEGMKLVHEPVHDATLYRHDPRSADSCRPCHHVMGVYTGSCVTTALGTSYNYKVHVLLFARRDSGSVVDAIVLMAEIVLFPVMVCREELVLPAASTCFRHGQEGANTGRQGQGQVQRQAGGRR